MAIILEKTGANKEQVIQVYCGVTGEKKEEAEDAIKSVPITINVKDETEAIYAFVEAGAVAVPEYNQVATDDVNQLKRSELLSVLGDIKK